MKSFYIFCAELYHPAINVCKAISRSCNFVTFYLYKFVIKQSNSKMIHTTSFRVAIFHTFFLTLLGLSHFNIRCIIITIYFDLQIKRRSIPLMVLGAVILRAGILSTHWLSKWVSLSADFLPLQLTKFLFLGSSMFASRVASQRQQEQRYHVQHCPHCLTFSNAKKL